MTTFGCDASSWNGALKFRDGLDFYTHKITDGDHFYADPTYQSHMTVAHQLGMPVLGSYHVQHGQRSITNQADWWLQMVQAQTPWWRQQAAFIWQCDAEPFGYNIAPTIDEINALGDAICQRAGVPASSYVAYAPAWFYGAKLTGLRYRQWQSNYAGNPATGYQAAYPGDASPRWSTYVNPLILQYGSRTTIGGLGGMDANAYRGTVDQLIADLGGKGHQITNQGDQAQMRFMFDSSIPGVPAEILDHVVLTDGFTCKIIAAAYQINNLHTAAGAGPIITVTADSVSREIAAGWSFDRIFNQLCGTVESVASPTDLSALVAKLANATQAAADALKS